MQESKAPSFETQERGSVLLLSSCGVVVVLLRPRACHQRLPTCTQTTMQRKVHDTQARHRSRATESLRVMLPLLLSSNPLSAAEPLTCAGGQEGTEVDKFESCRVEATLL